MAAPSRTALLRGANTQILCLSSAVGQLGQDRQSSPAAAVCEAEDQPWIYSNWNFFLL